MKNQWILHAGRMIETPRGSFAIRRGDDWNGSPAELDDAARLVAAAPALLAALRVCRTALNHCRAELREAGGDSELDADFASAADAALAAILAAKTTEPRR